MAALAGLQELDNASSFAASLAKVDQMDSLRARMALVVMSKESEAEGVTQPRQTFVEYRDRALAELSSINDALKIMYHQRQCAEMGQLGDSVLQFVLFVGHLCGVVGACTPKSSAKPAQERLLVAAIELLTVLAELVHHYSAGFGSNSCASSAAAYSVKFLIDLPRGLVSGRRGPGGAPKSVDKDKLAAINAWSQRWIKIADGFLDHLIQVQQHMHKLLATVDRRTEEISAEMTQMRRSFDTVVRTLKSMCAEPEDGSTVAALGGSSSSSAEKHREATTATSWGADPGTTGPRRKSGLPPAYEDLIRQSQALYSSLMTSLEQERRASLSLATAPDAGAVADGGTEPSRLVVKSGLVTLKMLWEPSLSVAGVGALGPIERLWNTGATAWRPMFLEVTRAPDEREHTVETYAVRRRSSGGAAVAPRRGEPFVKFSLRHATVGGAGNEREHEHVFAVTSVSGCTFVVAATSARERDEWVRAMRASVTASERV